MSTERMNAVQSCCFNTCVECDGPDERCKTCGWSPKEHKRRVTMRLLWTRQRSAEVHHEDGENTACTVQYIRLPRRGGAE